MQEGFASRTTITRSSAGDQPPMSRTLPQTWGLTDTPRVRFSARNPRVYCAGNRVPIDATMPSVLATASPNGQVPRDQREEELRDFDFGLLGESDASRGRSRESGCTDGG